MLRTERLILRPFVVADAPEVQRLAGVREVALNTINIPYPYPDGAAEAWIAKHGNGPEMTFAIEHEDQLIGAVGLVVDRMHDRAELGYWIGVPFWGRGFATEAAGEMVRYGFAEQSLHKIVAHVFSRNEPSARVLRKIGMSREGTLRQHFKKWGEYVDVDCYGLFRPSA
jgi:[ribosomal protein S5]-alanine N-acetyltransferase